MIIHAVSTRPCPVCCPGQFSYVAPVVITEHQGHVIGNAHALIVVLLDLFVQSPHLGCFPCRFAGDLLQNTALVIDYLFKQLNILFPAHGLISVSPHSYCYNAFVMLHSFNTRAPEVSEDFRIGSVIPGSCSVARPFHMGTHHGLMVRCSYNNPIFIGQQGIQGIIIVKGPPPHGRPQKIAPQAHDVFKNVFVKTAVERPVPLVYPSGQGWCFVIDKKAPVLHGRFSR